MRRPIAARKSPWAQSFARTLARAGVAPNTVSLASVIFALGAGVCLWATPRAGQSGQIALFLLAAALVQARLLCNLFDGMLAVEWKRASKLGPIFNDFPDRPADVFILVGCGLALGPHWMPNWGFAAAIMALWTAYTRVLGAAIGANEHFTGPMAKQHRMALVTLACLFSALESAFSWPHRAMSAVLILIVAGCIVTIWRRLRLIARDLNGALNGDLADDAAEKAA